MGRRPDVQCGVLLVVADRGIRSRGQLRSSTLLLTPTVGGRRVRAASYLTVIDEMRSQLFPKNGSLLLSGSGSGNHHYQRLR
jgi:hypothetical protein